MALSSLRLRRALPLSAPFLKLRPSAAALPAPPPYLPRSAPLTKAGPLSPISLGHCATQRLSFGSSAPLSDRRGGGGEDRKFDPDEILFEGCDYNHWLITMDFPKDPKPTPEEMVETYVQTLAKVVGSVEEAKKRMYACSTTTYTGFQAVMTEEMSEKFRGLPGVVFILPDSYIDPINKEYGGDKYDNGVITPRPPPVQYRRQGRYDDRNRNYGQPRHDRQRDMQQGNPSYDRQGPPQGEGRNFAPQQNFGQDRQGYGPPGGGNFAPERRDYGQGERRDYVQAGGRGNFPGGRDGYHGERRDSTPAYQAGVNMGRDGNLHPREQRDFSQAQRGNFPPQGPGNFPPQGPGSFPQGQHVYGGSDYGQSVSSSSGGAYQQDASAYGQNNTGSSGQNYGQNYQGPQTTPHIDHWDGTQSEQRNSTYPAQTGTQGRF